MIEAHPESDAEKAIGLYFRLRPNQKADLEVVARAALHWSATIRAGALALDPDAKIRIEIVDADEGSLQINTILDWVEGHLERLQGGAGKYPRLKALALGLLVFVAAEGADRVMERILDDPKTVNLSPEDRDLLRAFIDQANGAEDAKAERRKFFSEIEKDTSIEGVGLSTTQNVSPHFIIPRSDFPARSGLWSLEKEPNVRTRRVQVDAILISPALIARPRRWRFFSPERGEFSAVMRDEEFLAAVDQQHIRETLRSGIAMTMIMEIKEDLVGDVWVERAKKKILKVLTPEGR